MHLSWLKLTLVVITGIAAGTIDTIAGGGGMLTVPVLLGLGLPPVVALGTNRFQSILGESMATLRFVHASSLRLQDIRWGIGFTAIGAVLGTLSIQSIHDTYARQLIPWLLLLILLYTLFSKQFSTQSMQSKKAKLTRGQFYLICGLGIGFYNGFFGPSTGSFWIISFMALLGFQLQRAIVHAKPLNLTGNIISFTVFALAGHVAYFIGLMMGIGELIGANIGSHFVLYKSAKIIRPIFITVVFILTGYLFLKVYAGL